MAPAKQYPRDAESAARLVDAVCQGQGVSVTDVYGEAKPAVEVSTPPFVPAKPAQATRVREEVVDAHQRESAHRDSVLFAPSQESTVRSAQFAGRWRDLQNDRQGPPQHLPKTRSENTEHEAVNPQ